MSKKLPFAVQKVISLPGQINFMVDYEGEETFNWFNSRTKQLNVKSNITAENFAQMNEEYLTGTIGNILKCMFMSPYKQIKKPYTDGYEYESGETLTIDQEALRRITPAEFTEFVNWMGVSYPDFADGIKDNRELAKYYRA